MRVVEVFKTIQGEGILTGVVSVFVRFAGCNLRCKWCDEKASQDFDAGQNLSISELLIKMKKYKCKNVVITGGEPLLQVDIVDFTKQLKKEGYFITIETNTTLKKKVVCDLVSMSPKLSNSAYYKANINKFNKIRLNIDAIKYYIKNYNYQIKFVVSSEIDIKEIKKVLSKIKNYDKSMILMMPLASSRKQLYNIQKKIVKIGIENNLRYCNRLQLQIWGKGKEVKK